MRWPLVFLAGVCALTARRVTIHDRSTLPIAAHAASPVHLSSPVHHSARSAVPVCAVTAARAARNPKPHWEQKKATTVCWPQWPQLTTKTSEFDTLLKSFVNVTSTVPLRASESPTDEWREWSDGGFAAVKVVAAKLNRDRYMSVLACLRELVVRSQANCPELYAVLKFVPKKNGLNPLLAQLGDWDGGGPAADVPEELRLEGLKPREIRRRLDDLSRAFEQSWLLTSTYLSLPNKGLRDDFLWSARTVVEKIKTDQRSRALELLCLGVFHRDAKLFALVSGGGGGGGGGGRVPGQEGDHPRTKLTIRKGFERHFGVDVWHPKPTNARMIWQRCRMIYPFLEVAYRSWREKKREGRAAADPEKREEDADPDASVASQAAAEEADAAAIAQLLDRIARAGPEEKVP